MTAMLAHRGPEGEYQVAVEIPEGPTVRLGHRRLRVIDLSEAGRQPMANEDGSILVTFNGEIYNYRDLMRGLNARGHRFASKSDTEVIVHGYEEYGDEVVERLDGMFAFALWDTRRRHLLLARDRTGKKPLFYHFDLNGRRICFASEIKGLLVCPWVPRRFKEDGLPELLTYGYLAAPRTAFEGIMQLPPGSTLSLDPDRGQQVKRYWSVNLVGDDTGPTLDEACIGVRDRLTAAVGKRLMSDVPLGAFLSGGIDSSIVVGLMTQLLDEPVRTFTVGFSDEPSYDERGPARAVSEHFGTDHTEYVLTPRPVELLEKLLWHHDQPYGDSSAIPTYLVSQLAKQEVTVALVGDGGDEVFAGYTRFLAADLAQRTPAVVQRLAGAGARLLPRGGGYFNVRKRLERFSAGVGETMEQRYLGWVSIFGTAEIGAVLNPDLQRAPDTPTQRSFLELLAKDPRKPLIDRILEFNFETYLPEDLLVKVDRMSMAHALETRSPMLDTAVVEYAATLPAEFKIRGRTLKYVLKKSFEDLLPPWIAKRPKHGFGVPMDRWFQGELATVYRDTVLSSNALSSPYVDSAAALRLLEENLSGKRAHGARLWALLNLELWLRLIQRPVSSAPADPQLEVRTAK